MVEGRFGSASREKRVNPTRRRRGSVENEAHHAPDLAHLCYDDEDAVGKDLNEDVGVLAIDDSSALSGGDGRGGRGGCWGRDSGGGGEVEVVAV